VSRSLLKTLDQKRPVFGFLNDLIRVCRSASRIVVVSSPRRQPRSGRAFYDVG
jgi:hypothetical protein